MLTIRLSRTGKRKQPYYRVVLQEKSRDPWSPAIEVLGNIDPRKERSEATLNDERIKYWISQGAQVSAGLHNLFVDKKFIDGEKAKKVHISKSRQAKLNETQKSA